MSCLSGLGTFYAVGNSSYDRECSKKWNLQHQLVTLWTEIGYFVLLGNGHILVHCPTISYQRIKVYRVETMYMGIFRWKNGISGR